MKVITAKSAGFCWGVRRAVEKAMDDSKAAAGGERVYTDGPLIHNPGMIARLESAGVFQSDDPASLPAGATLVIRAHGIPPDRARMLSALPLKLDDATCPEVARIHKLIQARVASGYSVIIHGDNGHAEVVGLLGCARGSGYVVETPEDVGRLPGLGKVCVVAQTTQFTDAFDEIARAVTERFPDAEILDTICRATKLRQAELKELAKECDILVVVGSQRSANTTRLAKIAQRLRPTVLVQSEHDIDPGKFGGAKTIGLTAGASTPDATIQAVREKLEKL